MKTDIPSETKLLDASPNIELPDRVVACYPGDYRRPRGMLGGYAIEMFDDGGMSLRYEDIDDCFLVEVTPDARIAYFLYKVCEETCDWWWEEIPETHFPECLKVDLDYCIRETRQEAQAAPIVASF